MNYQPLISRVVGVALGLMTWGLLSVTADAAGPGPVEVYRAIPAATHCAAIGDAATSSTRLAANPELSRVCRFSSTLLEKEPVADPGFANTVEVDPTDSLADNPELMIARRYTPTDTLPDSAFLAANPELMAAYRYIPVENEIDPDSDIGLLEFFTIPNETGGQRAIERKADDDIGLLEFFRPPTIKAVNVSDQSSTFLAANPELMAAQRYSAVIKDKVTASSSLYWTPIWRFPHHYSAEVCKKAESQLLAANPELSIVCRYGAMIEWNHIHFPGR